MPVVRAGQPEIAGGGSLDRPVRWVHVSELPDVARLLVGRELILTTGQALAGDDTDTVAYLESLAAAGVSGLIVELGTYVRELPPTVAKTADRLGLPVVALHRVVRFVEVTEAVHRVIVADQYAELEFARTVHETFTALSVRRASLAEIVKTAAGMLDASVVLEDLTHRVLALTARHTGTPALLDQWESTSRMLSDADPNVVPVGPHTQRWGRLILRSSRVPTARARMVLERAAQTLTLHRMIERDRFGLHRQAQTGLIDDMVDGRLTDERDAVALAAALGLARRARYVPWPWMSRPRPNPIRWPSRIRWRNRIRWPSNAGRPRCSTPPSTGWRWPRRPRWPPPSTAIESPWCWPSPAAATSTPPSPRSAPPCSPRSAASRASNAP